MPKSQKRRKIKPAKAPLESALARAVVAHLENGTFLQQTTGRDSLLQIMHDPEDKDVMPAHSIDHWVRERIASAAHEALSSLFSMKLISRDRNISGAAGSLRPDALALDAHGRPICFEFKRSAEAARQALTEMLAYEQEIRNHLPLTAAHDVVFVLMSSEWSTLLDHAAAAAIVFGNRRVLCLELDVSAGAGAVSWSVRIPSAWALLGGTGFPAESLLATTIGLSPIPAVEEKGAKEFGIIAMQTVELMARELERAGAHGAALLWENVSEGPESRHGITLIQPNPFRLYQQALEFGLTNRGSALSAFLEAEGASIFGASWRSPDIGIAISTISPLLREIFTIDVAPARPWTVVRAELATHVSPTYVESWGVMGEFVRRQVTFASLASRHPHPADSPILADWRSPLIALNVIDELDGRRLFRDGFIRCEDAFELGRMVGTSARVRGSAARTPHYAREERWNDIDMIGSIREVQYLATAAVAVPDPPVQVPIGPGITWPEHGPIAFANWVKQSFLSGLQPYGDCFDVGMVQGLVPGDDVDEDFTEKYRSFTRMFVNAEATRSYLPNRDKYVVAAADSAWKLLGLSDAARVDPVGAMMELEDISAFAPALRDVARCYDGIFPPHFVKQKPVRPTSPDWDWFREGVALMIERGVPYPGIVLTPDGKLSTLEFPEFVIKGLMRPRRSINDPVLFSDYTTGTFFITEVTWDDLRTGKVIPISI